MAIDSDSVTFDWCTWTSPDLGGLVVAKLDANLLEDQAGLLVDQLDRFVRQDLVDGDVSSEARRHRPRRILQLASLLTTAGDPAVFVLALSRLRLFQRALLR